MKSEVTRTNGVIKQTSRRKQVAMTRQCKSSPWHFSIHPRIWKKRRLESSCYPVPGELTAGAEEDYSVQCNRVVRHWRSLHSNLIGILLGMCVTQDIHILAQREVFCWTRDQRHILNSRICLCYASGEHCKAFILMFAKFPCCAC